MSLPRYPKGISPLNCYVRIEQPTMLNRQTDSQVAQSSHGRDDFWGVHSCTALYFSVSTLDVQPENFDKVICDTVLGRSYAICLT